VNTITLETRRPMMPRPDPAIRPDAPMLEVVGRIIVPDLSDHRFVREAMAIANLKHRKQDPTEQVIGTANTKECELYGWAANVDSHVDNTGFMYLVPLVAEYSVLYVMLGDELLEQRLAVGEVVRLWDYALHWTEDSAPVMAAFVGSYKAPNDAEAVAVLANGVEALQRGDYYGAPRVRDGFRVLLPDECLATKDYETYEPMLLADVKSRGMTVLTCSHCDSPAHSIDKQWPYFWEHNVCAEHRHERTDE